MGEQGAQAMELSGYGPSSELGSSRCLGMRLWPRQISSKRTSLLAQGKDLAEHKRQVVMMKPTVEEHPQGRHGGNHVLVEKLGASRRVQVWEPHIASTSKVESESLSGDAPLASPPCLVGLLTPQ